MSEPVYKLVVFKGYTEAYYQLSKEEQRRLYDKATAVDEKYGVEWVVQCDSRWATEAIPWWDVIKYPSMEACQQSTAESENFDWWRYVDAESTLGTYRVELPPS